ncbi:uncharacterized protein PAC_16582 [Phialocephala subalpina]|uniref:Zn(2)-C6 fungal-type domain-containing protein n=1 Tax=Phialocephala subalpina TaxID=576137 RepID=A0A1L7XNP5_9HELO|nr:uncharacterized protein PAC_16582 [Phialocephala subalpina]
MARSNRTVAKPVHNRSRRGCLTCREHRIKCDEISPNCRNCRRLQQKCTWGVKVSFHQARMFSLSDAETETLQGIEEEREQIFVDETSELEAEYLGISRLSCRPHQSPETSPSTEGADGAIPEDSAIISDDIFHSTRFTGEPQRRPDSEATDVVLNPTLRPHVSTEILQPAVGLPLDTTARAYRALPDIPFDNRLKVQLISVFFREIASWFETTNSLRHFTALYGHLVTKSAALGAAAMSLASKFLGATTSQPQVSQDLYDFSTSLAAAIVDDNTLILTTIIHCMFSAMSMDPGDALQSFVQCATLLKSSRWSRSASGLPAAIYWAFARLDIWMAYSTKGKTFLPPDVWFGDTPDWNFTPLQDSYSNRAIRIFARIVDLLSEVRDSSQDPGRVRTFWSTLQTWNLERPEALKPIVEVDLPGNAPISTIIFSNASAVCGNVFFHAGCILLLETGYVEPSAELPAIASHLQIFLLPFANNMYYANLINNIEPVFIAARHCSTADEKLIALKHLRDIEVATGWKTSHKSKQLRELWGLQ